MERKEDMEFRDVCIYTVRREIYMLAADKVIVQREESIELRRIINKITLFIRFVIRYIWEYFLVT